MLKAFVIKSGLMVGSLIIADIIIGKLEDRALRCDIDKSFEPEKEGDKNTEDGKAEWAKLKPRVEKTLRKHGKL
jgi:hypothetical protein